MYKNQTLYFNKNKLYLITDELIEVNINLIDYITKNSNYFKHISIIIVN
jgi:hypothetical protein